MTNSVTISNTNESAAMECKFPALHLEDHEEALSIDDAQVPIELPSTEFQSWLHDFSRDQKIPLSDIFLALWGLILKTFTGNGAVCAASVIGTAQLELVILEIDEQVTMIELLRSLGDGKRHIQDHTSELPCNSAVYFASTREGITKDLKEVSSAGMSADQGRKLTLRVSSKYPC
jgi:hypothetical protein